LLAVGAPAAKAAVIVSDFAARLKAALFQRRSSLCFSNRSRTRSTANDRRPMTDDQRLATNDWRPM
jgi:hypothetical protein